VCAQVIDTVCSGALHSVYAVEENDGSAYSWFVEGGQIVSGNGSHSIIVNWQTKPGTYRVSVTERNITGCAGVPQHAYIMVRGTQFKTSFPDKGCLLDSVNITASGGRWYKWSNGLTDSSITLKLVGDTVLSVIISDTVCGINNDTFPVSIKAIVKPDVAIISDAEQVYKNQSVHFDYGGSAHDIVNWQIEKSTMEFNSNHGINVRFIDTGSAMVKLISTNILGCKDSAYKRIEVVSEELFFPNAFTPNQDGINDVFKPGGNGIVYYRLNIFNSWGQLIFVSNDVAYGWDGSFNGEPVQTGSYIYQCEVIGSSGRKNSYHGTVTLIR
jgi:gliding motility-associated-like protein